MPRPGHRDHLLRRAGPLGRLGDQPSALLPHEYVAARRAGRRRIRCCCRRVPTPTRTWPGRCSTGSTALVVAGGADVDPSRYGADAAPERAGAAARPRRLGARAARRGRRAAGLPVLGICRGMQVMAVAGRRHARPARARPGRPRRGTRPGRGRLRRASRCAPSPGTPAGRAGRRPGGHARATTTSRCSTHPGYVAGGVGATTARWRRWRSPAARVPPRRAVAPRDGPGRPAVRGPRRRLPVSGATDHIPRRGFTVRTGGGSLPPVKTTWAVMATATLIID